MINTVNKTGIYVSFLVFLMLVTQISCQKDSEDKIDNGGYISDINALQTIQQDNPQSNLEWNFCFDDPNNPIISNYGENSHQADIEFEEIDGEQRITGLNIASKNISKLENLIFFSELKVLDCHSNQISNFNISGNKNLTRLICGINQMNSLDVSKNKELLWLDCSSNKITSLNISDNKKLIWIDCNSNLINSLDVSKNEKMYFLNCSSNQINSLDISKNKNVNTLNCHSNGINSLDVSKNEEMCFLNCSSTQINSLNISKNKKLTWLDCSSNPCSTEKYNSVVILKQFYDKAQSLSVYDEFYIKPARNIENESIYSVVEFSVE